MDLLKSWTRSLFNRLDVCSMRLDSLLVSEQILFVLPFILLTVHVRVANSKPELSQLLFISVRQRELVKSFCWIWSIYLYRFYLVCALVSYTTMWLCDSWPVTSCVMWHDHDHSSLSNLWCYTCVTSFPMLLWSNQKEKKRKRKEK